MVHVTVVNSHNLMKYIKFIILLIIASVSLFLLYNYKHFNIISITNSSKLDNLYYSCIDDSLPGIKLANNSAENKTKTNFLQTMLYTELPILKESSLKSDIIDIAAPASEDDSPTNSLTYASGDVSTQTIENNVPNTYTNNFGRC